MTHRTQVGGYTVPLLSSCISCGALIPQGTSRCRTHATHYTPTPARRASKEAHGYAHQLRARRMLVPGALCAMRYLANCRGPLQVDYIQPISLGGQPTDENAQVLCQRHNIAKGGRNRLKP